MRVSADPTDPGYHTMAHRCRVIFNGVEQTPHTGRLIITADEDQGLIIYNKMDADGCLVAEGDNIVSFTDCGEVSIVWNPSP